MKTKTFLTFSLILISILGYSQNLSTEVRKDFCKNAIMYFKYGSDSFKYSMINSARYLGYNTPLKIEIAVENLCSNYKLQEELMKNIDRLGGSREFKEQQYIAIGVKPYNAKLLNDYMILKYHTIDSQNKEKELQNLLYAITDKDSINLSNKEIINAFYPKSKFINDSVAVRLEGINKFETEIIEKYKMFNEKDETYILFYICKSKLIDSLNSNREFVEIFKIKEGGGRALRSQLIETTFLKNINYKVIEDYFGIYFVIEYVDNDKKIRKNYDLVTFTLHHTNSELVTTKGSIEKSINKMNQL